MYICAILNLDLGLTEAEEVVDACRFWAGEESIYLIDPGWTFDFTCFPVEKHFHIPKRQQHFCSRVTGLIASMSLCENNGA